LTQEELESLSRIVNAYLDIAEDMAKRNIPMTMEDWAKRLDMFLRAADRGVLKDAETWRFLPFTTCVLPAKRFLLCGGAGPGAIVRC
jgi:hypothetical protein